MNIERSSCNVLRHPARQKCLRHVFFSLAFVALVSITSSVSSKASPAQIEKRNQEFDENERNLKRQLYGVEKPWELLVPYGADIVKYNYRRTYPEVYDKEEAERRKLQREAENRIPKEEHTPEQEELSQIKEATHLLWRSCDEGDVTTAQIEYEQLRRLNWNDFEREIDYAYFLKSKKMYSQARDVVKNAMPHCKYTDQKLCDLLNKQFQMDLVPPAPADSPPPGQTDLKPTERSPTDDEFKSRRPRNKPQPSKWIGRKQS